DERFLSASLLASLPFEEEPEQEDAADDEPEGERDSPELATPALRPDPAPGAGLQHSENRQREAGSREDHADVVELLPCTRRLVDDPAAQDQDRDHDHDQHLTGEDVAPAPIGREETT